MIRKLRSARVRFRQALERWEQTSLDRRKKREFNSWLTQLKSFPPQVLIGSNFAEFGGVRHHIHSVRKFSRFRVELAPPDELLRVMSAHDVRTTFRDAFFEYDPQGVSAVHSHVFPWFIEWCLTRKVKRAKWVHTYHLPYFAEHAIGGIEPWQEEINRALVGDARHADVRLSVSRWQQAFLAEKHGITTSYLPNGVDVSLCDKADANRFTRLTGLNDFVLYVGRNDPVKNPADFVQLAMQMRSTQFLMVGRDLSKESLMRDWSLDVPSNLVIQGELSHGAVHDAIAASRAVVVTSKREGLPTLVLEVMALRKNVVVPREPGCLEAVDDGNFGFVYEPGDLSDLAEKTASAIDAGVNPRARDRVLAEFDWQVIAPKLDAIYAT
jgi:glycosyltransferase involved in cell wall biosynthesis